MVKKFDVDKAALQDIAARPEVTGTQEATIAPEVAQRQSGPANIKPVIDADPEREARDGRMIASAFAEIFRSMSGGELSKDHESAVSEFGAFLSGALREFNISRGAYVAFLGLVLAAPLVPLAFKLLQPKEGAQNAAN